MIERSGEDPAEAVPELVLAAPLAPMPGERIGLHRPRSRYGAKSAHLARNPTKSATEQAPTL